MSLHHFAAMINRIYLRNFRNFESLDLKLAPILNVFVGSNAQGKTNILESIYFAALGISRAPSEAALIRWGEDSALIRIEFERAGVSHSLAIDIAADRRRRIFMDSQPIPFRSLLGRFTAVMFSPDNLFLFKAPPAARRKFLDTLISQLHPPYFSALNTYRRVLAHRNALLKDIRAGAAQPSALSLWNEHLAAAAAPVLTSRLDAVSRLSALANDIHRDISSARESLSISYAHPAASLADALAANQFADIRRGFTSAGPHLDDISFSLNDIPILSSASQGQIRSAALALVLAQLRLLRSSAHDSPILLLDDVFSELDSSRRDSLLAFLFRERVQALITAVDSASLPPTEFASFFHFDCGAIS